MIGVNSKSNPTNNDTFSYLVLALLMIFVLFGLANPSQANPPIRYIFHRSQFTLPPTLTPQTTCNENSSIVKEGIRCFKLGLFKSANLIFKRIRRQAIKKQQTVQLLNSYLYLALIAIEKKQNKKANRIIKHIFFLRANFDPRRYKITKRKYLKRFHKIKKRGRKLRAIEIDDITKKKFIRVTSCRANQHCKNGVWIENSSKTAMHSTINNDLDCSLKGNCKDGAGNKDSDIACSLEGTC